ncbi:60Kd inner membrane protein-domain-containing protein [Lipomyces chichibuensis]|uniref:60Kd inner membrane protein-domain-containing protein n=1 Tax=Lipomyces chichibuensis TaxID=1546026 RepID=UPI00334350E5
MSTAGSQILSISLRASRGLGASRLLTSRSLNGGLVQSHSWRIQLPGLRNEPFTARFFSFGRSPPSSDLDRNPTALANASPSDTIPSWKPNGGSEFVEDVPQLTAEAYNTDLSNLAITEQPATDVLQTVVTHAGQSSSDHIGYLESIGLAKSWIWPGDVCQHLLEYFHVYTGLPWWATIIGASFAVRVLTFPLYLKSSDMTARAAIANPIINEMTMELLKSGQVPMQEIQKRRKEVLREHGVDTRWMLAPLLLNLFFGMGFFFGLERMAHADMPDLKTQGAYWFEDLTKKDPYLVLSVLPAILFMILFKGGGETGVQSMSPKMVKIFMALPFISILFTMNLPAAVLLNFTASSLVGAIQATVLKSAAFRRMAGLAPIVKRKPTSTESTDSMRKQMQVMVDALKKAAAEEAKKNKKL